MKHMAAAVPHRGPVVRGEVENPCLVRPFGQLSRQRCGQNTDQRIAARAD